MARTPQPRFSTDFRLVIDISAASEAEAAERLQTIQDFVTERLDRTTFRRLAGQPEVTYSDFPSDILPT